MLALGTLLAGRYRILDVLGDGGMARVFRARDERLDRVVAIKTLHQQYLSQPEFVRRFEQEARLAASLSHPNIVAIYDVDRADDIQFIVMEYVEGGSLKTLIAHEAPLPLKRVVPIAYQLGSALDAAHAHGVIHRDVKPENILLTPVGDVKVGDFGIARALTGPGQTATGMVLGSVSYFSPEQAQGKPATAESDIYSSAVVLYEMLTGRLPFAANNPLATAMQHITQPPVPPRSLVPDIPEAASQAILKALHKDPARRFHSGLALAEALAAAAGIPAGYHATPAAAPITQAPTVVVRRSGQRPKPSSARRAAPHVPAPPRRRLSMLPLALVLLAGGGAAYAYTHSSGLDHLLGLGPHTGAAPTPTVTPTIPPSPTAITPLPTQTPTTRTGVVTGIQTVTPSATSTATRTALPSPSATAHPAQHPRPPATATRAPVLPVASSAKGTGVTIYTALGYVMRKSGRYDPVGPRDTFSTHTSKIYAVFHVHHAPIGSVITARWHYPDGSSQSYQILVVAYNPNPSGYTYIETVVPGRYTVTALVDGKPVGSKQFWVKESHAAGTGNTGTSYTAQNGGSGPQEKRKSGKGTGHDKHGDSSTLQIGPAGSAGKEPGTRPSPVSPSQGTTVDDGDDSSA